MDGCSTFLLEKIAGRDDDKLNVFSTHRLLLSLGMFAVYPMIMRFQNELQMDNYKGQSTDYRQELNYRH